MNKKPCLMTSSEIKNHPIYKEGFRSSLGQKPNQKVLSTMVTMESLMLYKAGTLDGEIMARAREFS